MRVFNTGRLKHSERQTPQEEIIKKIKDNQLSVYENI